jgi:hypothetical protein
MQGYRIVLKDGSAIVTDPDGNIALDGTRNYRREPTADWRIVGIGTRHMSTRLVSLDAAADGEPIGQGWVHDLDHGAHRMWAMPRTHRAIRVERI